jgi:hypothetical protein
VSALLEAALDYAARGWPVLPVKPRGKDPLTKNGVKDATTDERTILHWWTRWPEANIGVATGAPGPQALDVDDPSAVPQDIAQAFDAAPHTASPRGGAAFFAGTDSGTVNLGYGELRGRGSYQLVPPSVHPSGDLYVWLVEPRSRVLSPVPSPLVERAQAQPSKGAGVVTARTAKVAHGERHDHLCDLALRMVRSGVLDKATVVRMLEVEYEQNCEHDPPPSRTEFTDCADWALDTRIAKRERDGAETAPDASDDASNGGPPESLLIDMRAALNDAMQPLPHRVGSLATDGFLTLLVGRRGDNKTWLGMFACNAVHNGIAIPPFSVRQGPALLVDAESGARLLGRRFLTLGLEGDAFHVADARELRLPGDIDRLYALVESTGAKLVVIDSLRRMAPNMREDKSDDTAPVMAALANLARDTDAPVVALHHKSTKPNAPDVRGSSALEDQADAVFVLERRRGDPERWTRRRLRCTKMRPDVEPPPMWLSFKVQGGFMTLSEAEPYTGASDGEDEDARSADEVMADRLRLLATLVSADEGWSPKRLALSLGTAQDNSTFKRACALVIESGEWAASGKTRDRRLRPSVSGQSGNPLGESPNGPNQEAPAELIPDTSEDPPGNAVYGPEDA